MKKLILSLAALAFATMLFSQGDSNDAQDTVKNDAVIKVEPNYIADMYQR